MNENSYMQRVTFANGWTASVICCHYSHGFGQGLFEVALLDKLGQVKSIKLAEPKSLDKTLGHCDFYEVADVLKKIEALPAA
jgi:hypothetical protein